MRPHDWHRRWQKFFKGLGSGGVSYLLYDTFTTARSAGSVNGTPAEPTGQSRTVTDTNSKMAIIAGLLNVGGGGVGEMNPGMWWPSFVRQAGLIGLFDLLVDGSSVNGMTGGWYSSAANAGGNTIRPVLGALLGVRSNGGAISVGNDLGLGVNTYKGAISLRSVGAYMFIKGGVFTFWTLIWIGLTGNATPMFFGVGAVSNVAVDNVDNARVPTILYIPPSLMYDTFTRVNGALGNTEIVSPDGVSIAALIWNFTTGVWTIVSNVAVGTPNLGADAIVNGGFGSGANWTPGAGWTIAAGLLTGASASSDTPQNPAVLTVGLWYQAAYTVSAFAAGTVQLVIGGVAFPTHAANATYTETGRALTTAYLFRGAGWTGSVDNASAKVLATADLFSSVLLSTADVFYDVAITLPAALGGVQGGIVCNLDSVATPANFIIAYLDGRGNVVLDECVAGVYTNKFTAAITYVAAAVLRIERNGTECRVFYNNLAVSTVQTMTANVNKNVGNFSTSPLVSFDNATAWARGTSGEYEAALNAL